MKPAKLSCPLPSTDALPRWEGTPNRRIALAAAALSQLQHLDAECEPLGRRLRHVPVPCRGVWLDRGELEKILSAEHARTGRPDPVARERFDREIDAFHRDPEAWKRSHPYNSQAKRYKYDDDDYRYRKKKKGFDIFDIFD